MISGLTSSALSHFVITAYLILRLLNGCLFAYFEDIDDAGLQQSSADS